MVVSIVIVSYNTRRLLDECIASIKRQTAVSYEIIVVDNASRDDSTRMLKERYPEVRLIENSDNAGFAKANNQGFEVARGKYFFMLNSDTVILDGAIDKLVDFMEKIPDAGICAPRNVGRSGELQYSCDHFPGIWNTLCAYSALASRFPKVKMFRRTRMQYWDYAEVRDVERVAGCSLMIRSELFKRLGGLDPGYFMYFEETDLCYRVIREGWRVVYLPHAAIIHYGGESSVVQTGERVINRTIYSYYLVSQYYFFSKNYGFLAMIAIRGLDTAYGMVLLARNTFRRNKLKRDHGLAKGKALCSSALRFQRG